MSPAYGRIDSSPASFLSIFIGVACALAVVLPAAPVQAQQLCVHSQGYWRTHPEEWKADSLVLGSAAVAAHTYNKRELLSLLGASAGGDASLILATQQIAALLNLAAGSNPAPAADSMARANT